MKINLKNSIILLNLSVSPLILSSQGTFDVIPVTDGQQSQLYDVYADSSFIYVIGDLLDTTITPPGQTIVPWWGVFNYDGSLVSKYTLFDKNLSNFIGVYGSRILKNSKGNFIYAPIIYNNSGWAECLVLEIEPSTGEIIQYNIIGNLIDSSSYVIPRWVALDPNHKGQILLSGNLEINKIQRGIVFSLDSQLLVTNYVLIDDNGRDNYNCYLESETDSTFILIGDSRKRNDNSQSPDTKPFFMRINSAGKILTFNLARGIPDKSVGFFLSENMSVKRDVNNNWIFSALSYFPGWHSFPYVFSYDSEFINMNWAINFSPDVSNPDQQHNLFGGDYDPINGTYVVVGDDNYQNDSYIFKTNDQGDSLWTRHFIPLNWKPEDVGYAGLIDVKATPYHSYVSVGKAVGRPDFIWKSWAILIDSFGCIIPGCQNTVGNSDINSISIQPFSIYPNPSSTYIGLLCNQKINSDLKLTVSEINGRILEDVKLSPTIGYQYILNVSDWTKGMYLLRIESNDGKFIQVSQIIVN